MGVGFIGNFRSKHCFENVFQAGDSPGDDHLQCQFFPQLPGQGKIHTQYSVREDLKHSVRILLAEDNLVNQKLAKLMLGKAGYQVEVANNGAEAVDIYTADPDTFDLIFMDVQMPEMDGKEATQTIRKKGFHRVPIIAMTAHAMKGDREMCLEAGMNDYITKPIKREAVFSIIEKNVFNKEAA